MNTPNLNGWEKLICPFFGPTCRRVLGNYLEENGFTEKGQTEIGGITFSRFGVFLEINYELEMFPQSLTIAIGVGDEKYNEGRHPCFVPYWYLIPRSRTENRAGFTRFKNEGELEALLTHFRDNVLESDAKSFWLDVEKLELAIGNFRAEFSC